MRAWWRRAAIQDRWFIQFVTAACCFLQMYADTLIAQWRGAVADSTALLEVLGAPRKHLASSSGYAS